jgi:hypothetical protein
LPGHDSEYNPSVSVLKRKLLAPQYWLYIALSISVLLLWPASKGYNSGIDLLGVLLPLIYVEVELALFSAISRVPFTQALIVVITSDVVTYILSIVLTPLFILLNDQYMSRLSVGTEWPYGILLLVTFLVAIKFAIYLVALRKYGVSRVFLAAIIANLIAAGLVIGTAQLLMFI